MPMCEIKDHKTGETLKAYDFGGPEIYYAGTSLVYAPLGGTSVSTVENIATLNPLGLTSIMKQRWEVTGHVGIGTANWRVSVIDTSTGETKDDVYPFNLKGNVYELECQPGTWVIASCGGYKIESSWSGQTAEQVYRLKGTGEIIKIQTKRYYISTDFFIGRIGIPEQYLLSRTVSFGGELRGQSSEGVWYPSVPMPIFCTCAINYNKNLYNYVTLESLYNIVDNTFLPDSFIYQGRTFINTTTVNPYVELFGGNDYVINYKSVSYLEIVL